MAKMWRQKGGARRSKRCDAQDSLFTGAQIARNLDFKTGIHYFFFFWIFIL